MKLIIDNKKSKPSGSSAQYDLNFINTERVCLIEELHSKEVSCRWPDPYCETLLWRDAKTYHRFSCPVTTVQVSKECGNLASFL